MLLISLFRWIKFALQVHNEFSCVHVLIKYSLHPLQLLFESGVFFFVQHVWRCSYCSRTVSDQVNTEYTCMYQTFAHLVSSRSKKKKKKKKNTWKSAHGTFLLHLDVMNVMADYRYTPG